MSKLSPRQQRFVQEYLKDLNATQAAIRAGYSKKTAKQIGSRLLTDVDVQEQVEAGKNKAAERASITVDSVIGRLDAIARRANADDDRPAEIRALELLGKHVGAFTDRLELKGSLNVTQSDIDRRLEELVALAAGRC